MEFLVKIQRQWLIPLINMNYNKKCSFIERNSTKHVIHINIIKMDGIIE